MDKPDTSYCLIDPLSELPCPFFSSRKNCGCVSDQLPYFLLWITETRIDVMMLIGKLMKMILWGNQNCYELI